MPTIPKDINEYLRLYAAELEGRVLSITPAVSKAEATRLTTANTALREQTREKDKRRLYLLSEGNLSSLPFKVSPTEATLMI